MNSYAYQGHMCGQRPSLRPMEDKSPYATLCTMHCTPTSSSCRLHRTKVTLTDGGVMSKARGRDQVSKDEPRHHAELHMAPRPYTHWSSLPFDENIVSCGGCADASILVHAATPLCDMNSRWFPRRGTRGCGAELDDSSQSRRHSRGRSFDSTMGAAGMRSGNRRWADMAGISHA